MGDDFLKAAEEEAATLRLSLAMNPVFKRLQAVEKLIADYRSTESPTLTPVRPLAGNIAKSAKYGRQGSAAATVIEAAEQFLKSHRKRAMSGEILAAVQKDGVTVPGKNPASTLSSYLSTSPLFDNRKGEGYGLAEWNQEDLLADAPEWAR